MRFSRKWLLWLALGGLIVLAQKQLWWSRDSFPEDAGLARAIRRQQHLNRRLERTNRMLYAEVMSLEKGTGAVAQQARGDLDFIRPGETFYEIVHSGRTPASHLRRRASSRPSPHGPSRP